MKIASTEEMPSIKKFFPSIKNDLTKLTWAHHVNSDVVLQEALEPIPHIRSPSSGTPYNTTSPPPLHRGGYLSPYTLATSLPFSGLSEIPSPPTTPNKKKPTRTCNTLLRTSHTWRPTLTDKGFLQWWTNWDANENPDHENTHKQKKNSTDTY
uniref:(California timema) hypothetical protein n=1 Tax=Timema californicum TaxID=61474 RepID=A0A7R9P874_TIMCA|nr:unnamed protein product [Timema californicum]